MDVSWFGMRIGRQLGQNNTLDLHSKPAPEPGAVIV